MHRTHASAFLQGVIAASPLTPPWGQECTHRGEGPPRIAEALAVCRGWRQRAVGLLTHGGRRDWRQEAPLDAREPHVAP